MNKFLCSYVIQSGGAMFGITSIDRRTVAVGAISLAVVVLVGLSSGGATAGAGYVACDQVTDNGAIKTGCGGSGGYLGAKGGAYAGGAIGSAAGPVGTVAGGAVGAFAGAA